MTLLERLRKAGISDEDIISTFQFKTSGYRRIGKKSYMFGNSENHDTLGATINFNKKGKLSEIITSKFLRSKKSQIDFVENILNDINGDHGYLIRHRILFSRKPLKGIFQWKDEFRIRPCLNKTQIGKELAWGIENSNNSNDTEKHLGPPYPFILEVRIKKSPNTIIETNRYLQALDLYEWLLYLLLPQLLGVHISKSGQPKWTILMRGDMPEYHLTYEGFNAHESEIESNDTFSTLQIPDVAKYTGEVEYYNHLWIRSNEIELPMEMEKYLNLYERLPIKTKEKFKRSLYWFNIGSTLYNQKQLSIIPFTIAIECLLPKPSQKVCPTCTKPLGDGPTKLFRAFMENHLSLPENIEHLKKSMYPKRSSMVHGSFAIAADYGYFTILDSDETELSTEIFTRRALINWLVKETFE